MSKVLVRGGRLIDPANGVNGLFDVLLEGGLVRQVANAIHAPDAQIVSAEGRLVLPGFVDIHCHLREPGYEYKEDIASGTRAAARGGFTSICCMANTSPVNDNAGVTAFIRKKAEEDGAGVRVYPVGAVTKGLEGLALTDFAGLKAAGAVALSDDGRPIADAGLFRRALELADAEGLLLLCHCEDLLLVNDGVMNEGLVSARAGLAGSIRAAEEVMIARDILVAEALGARVHICHVSTKGGVQLIREAKARGVGVAAETAPHYLAATDAWVERKGTLTRVNPPLRTEDDRLACIYGLADGTLDCIATDHAPHHANEKATDYPSAASGISGFETAFAICWTHLVEHGYMEPDQLVALMTNAPARLLGLPAGSLAVGDAADLVIADPHERWTVDASDFISKGKNTPFSGETYTGRVRETFVAGQRVFKEA
ncbi:MAG: dihydroorotase [Clostridia bacterium]|nr:dihydroorotase [Clostridia bacterium]